MPLNRASSTAGFAGVCLDRSAAAELGAGTARTRSTAARQRESQQAIRGMEILTERSVEARRAVPDQDHRAVLRGGRLFENERLPQSAPPSARRPLGEAVGRLRAAGLHVLVLPGVVLILHQRHTCPL